MRAQCAHKLRLHPHTYAHNAHAQRTPSGMANAVGVFYNYTRELTCFDPGFGPNPETDEDGNFWCGCLRSQLC